MLHARNPTLVDRLLITILLAPIFHDHVRRRQLFLSSGCLVGVGRGVAAVLVGIVIILSVHNQLLLWILGIWVLFEAVLRSLPRFRRIIGFP